MPQSYLFVRSADRTLGTSSAFRVQLPVAYRTVTSISLVSAELPYSMYNVVAPYLRGVMFTHNGLTYVPILPVGFYTIDDLTGYLQGVLQSAFPSAGITSVGYSKTSGRLYIVYTSGLVFGVNSDETGLGTQPSGVETLASGGVLLFPGVATLAPISTLFMRIAELPTLMTSTNGQTAFARLQLSGAPGSIVMSNVASSVTNVNAYATPIAALSTLTVSLYTQDGVAVSLNGCEWTFTLLLSSAA